MAKLSQKNNTGSTSTTTTTVTKVKRTRRSVPRDYPPQRSSIYRGVTRHRWTGRYEAHLWDKNCWNESQNKKGRQVYLGAYDDEEAAAHTYDLAALKYWGEDTILNFPVSTYENELKGMEGLSREEYIGSLRRKSSGFSRGVSKYRGVARHHHNGRWEARIGRVFGNKYLYLGTYATQEEAATAYDLAAIEYRGLNAVTNFDLSRYIKWLKPNNNMADCNDGSLINSNPTTQLNLNNYSNPSLGPSPNDQEQGGGLHFLINQPSALINHGDQSMVASQPRSTTTTAMSALGLLLQSSKFKEMMEMTSAVDQSVSSTQPDHHQAALPQCSFPKEIQTYFGSENPSSSYNEGGEFLFGNLNSFNPTMFPCDFEA